RSPPRPATTGRQGVGHRRKRWHDIDMSGWWQLVNLIPVVGSFIALVANGFLPGTDGENHFGPATRLGRKRTFR
ncbi:MAG: DUF805 domain-containing protein, partial [Acidiferrobacterales bacterium]